MAERRKIDFQTFEALESDLQALQEHGYDRAGQWSLPQILDHLSKSMDGTTVPNPKGMPRPIRWVARAVVKPLLYRRRRMPSGLPSGKEMLPADSAPLPEAVERFLTSLDKVKKIPGPTVDHPVFGHISVEDFRQFHLIHATHHFSFVTPLR